MLNYNKQPEFREILVKLLLIIVRLEVYYINKNALLEKLSINIYNKI